MGVVIVGYVEIETLYQVGRFGIFNVFFGIYQKENGIVVFVRSVRRQDNERAGDIGTILIRFDDEKGELATRQKFTR